MSNLTPFSQTLSKLNRGELNDELTDVLAEVVKAVRQTRKQPKIQSKLHRKLVEKFLNLTVKKALYFQLLVVTCYLMIQIN